jgi:hypothetical protein
MPTFSFLHLLFPHCYGKAFVKLPHAKLRMRFRLAETGNPPETDKKALNVEHRTPNIER